MRKAVVVVLLAAAVACSDSSTSVTPSSTSTTQTTTTTTPTPPPNIVITGKLTATVTGGGLGGVSLDLATNKAVTDASGGFRYEFVPGTVSASPLLTISGPGVVSRVSTISLMASRDLNVDAIASASAFDLAFYREIARNNYEEPGVLRPIRRWTSNPRVYLKTVDEAGAAIEAETLDAVETAIRDSVAPFTGGLLALAELERGTETREGQSGWITVKFPSQPDPNYCGRAQVAVNGGWIELYYRTPNCSASCSHSREAPKVVRHELGHALGFWHSSNTEDLMWGGTWRNSQCNLTPTAREQFHGAIMYSRPLGNADPDTDPATTYLSAGPPVVVVN